MGDFHILLTKVNDMLGRMCIMSLKKSRQRTSVLEFVGNNVMLDAGETGAF